jgi:hypothetical protein
MSQLGHVHDFQPTALYIADTGGWRERQVCSQCPWEIRYLVLDPTPEDEPPAAHPAPCWCPQCMNRRRK